MYAGYLLRCYTSGKAMRYGVPVLAVALGACIGLAHAENKAETAVERGQGLAHGAPPLNPPVWSTGAYAKVWKQWGLSEKPADFDKRFRERYGLHEAPYTNGGLPMGMHVSSGLFGKGIVTDCLMCHAGRVAGKTIIGLANSTMDPQALFDEMFTADAFPIKSPVALSSVRGTIDPVSPVAFLMEFRDLDLNFGKSGPLPKFEHVSSDPPAWWLLKKKKTRNWMGLIDANSIRVDMPNLLSPFNSGEYIRKQEPAFADIHQFILSLEAPRFPFPIDPQKAHTGRAIFTQHCSRCHGTYGSDASYPNKIVTLETIGTDPLLAESITDKAVEHFNRSWLGREKGKDGKPIQAKQSLGYQAPPLDGIWATGPYFHNSSVPTVYHVLNSKARPKVFTRSYGTEVEDYDAVKVGWKITPLAQGADAKMPAIERRKIYDTSLPGQANTGHTFGDALTEQERIAVIEYLKTL
jgi:mono/diheme cytochrome c family protein